MSKLRPNEAPMPDALAYFLTWTTYGTWLPGDERGWTKKTQGGQLGNAGIESFAKNKLVEPPLILDVEQRKIVEVTVAAHCDFRNWNLLAVNCRTNHAHAIIEANENPKIILAQLKAWCTRRLKDYDSVESRLRWWSENGSIRPIEDEDSLDRLVYYVVEGQDKPKPK